MLAVEACDSRISDVVCARGRPHSRVSAAAQFRAVPFVSGLSSPLAFVQDPGDATIQYVLQQGGRIRLIRNGVLQSTPFPRSDLVDLQRRRARTAGHGAAAGLRNEWTLLRKFHQHRRRHGHRAVQAVVPNPLAADASSRFDLLWSTGERVIRQPFSNHNGGTLVFGPDGYLYIGMGDGGSGNDPQHLAQNMGSLLGKMLRIDVSVPDCACRRVRRSARQPVRGRSAPEIWSIGLRNPWKFSFDDPARGGTGAMLIADVGQGALEEIDYEPAGAERRELRLAQPRRGARQQHAN